MFNSRDLKDQFAVSGQRSAVSGQRSAVSGQRSAVSGQRSAVSGQRSAVSGQRSAVSGQRSGSKIKHRALCKPSFYIIGESLPRALSQHVKLPARRKAPPTFNPNTVLGLIFCWQLTAED
ncbi:hypothetical protein [Pseudoalteromonas sp. DL-6]|uniref:hypothetical protein n=1 Tax=Pseudoalteromonas sp. DL-6 TaxID=1390185 RepID=UPI003204B294